MKTMLTATAAASVLLAACSSPASAADLLENSGACDDTEVEAIDGDSDRTICRGPAGPTVAGTYDTDTLTELIVANWLDDGAAGRVVLGTRWVLVAPTERLAARAADRLDGRVIHTISDVIGDICDTEDADQIAEAMGDPSYCD